MDGWFFGQRRDRRWVLSPYVSRNGMFVEFSGGRYIFASFVREGVVDNNNTVTALPRVFRWLEKLNTFVVEMIFAPVVLG